MTMQIPSAADVRARLGVLSRSQVIALAEKTGVPFTTLNKIRRGETEDPRIETVRLVWPEISGGSSTEVSHCVVPEARE